MNKQEVFDKVANHLLTQNRKAINTGNLSPYVKCVYRTDDGLKCAIGCLIPDHLYDTKIEGCSPNVNPDQAVSPGGAMLSKILISQLGELTEQDYQFLKELQFIHDTCEVQYWKDDLTRLGINNNLNINF